MDNTPTAETTGTIAFQGEPGAYSHLACRKAFPSMEPLAFPTFAGAFKAVESGAVDYAMIPIENSLGGRVADIHHLLPDSSLFIVAEHFQPIHHCLLGAPGASLESIQRVESHPQALAQCRELITELGVEAVPVADTAGAAKDIGERGDPKVGALASVLAGEVYGLEVLRKRVEDRLGNTTRFIVMSRTRQEADLHNGAAMTSLLFQVRSVPAALYKSLAGFATAGVNITKLESYIVDGSFTAAQFYAEIEGHPSDALVKGALDELQYFSTNLRVLGVYRQHTFRAGS
ncbi:MAG: prephenate dehydratase [Acidimicrobiia bacterium]